jgi:hypothetical protein
MSVIHLGSVVKANSNTNTSSTMNYLYNTHIRWIRANNSHTPLFRGPAFFNSSTTIHKKTQVDDKLITGWAILTLP